MFAQDAAGRSGNRGKIRSASRRRALLVAATAGLALLAGTPTAFAAAGVSPLREVQAKKRAALQQPAAQSHFEIKARTTAESRSGVRRLRIGDFQYLSDSDRDYAGYDLGAGSWDTFAAIVASALADEFLIQATAANIPVDAIDVIFTSTPDTPEVAKTRKVSYPRNLAYVAHIDSPATDAQLEQLRQTVERVSPVLSIVRDSQQIGHGPVKLTASPALRDPDLPPGLRDFLVEKRQAILRRQARREAAAKAPVRPGAQAAGLRAHAHVEPNTGIRNTRTGTGNYQIVHDSRAGQLGYGLAPTVEEHQIGVLGTCLTHIFEIEAAKRQVMLDSLELRTEATLSPRVDGGAANPPRFRNISYSVHIESPAPAPVIEELRTAVEGSCPIYNLLKDSQPIDGRVVRGRYAG